ncbi:MAG: hypothetical protein SFW35_05835 [Chitinophagales bacterium]|nr:hypothetical protein [Chitinophagales bacterium]
MNSRWQKFDTFWFGTICGLLGPILGMFIFYLLKFTSMPFPEFVASALKPNVLSPLISVGAFLVNLGLFFLFLNINWNLPARGVIFATFILAIIVLVLQQL